MADSRLFEAEGGIINPDITELIMRFVRPELFEESVSVYRHAQGASKANTGILSYGVPVPQLTKIFARLIAEQEMYGKDGWLPGVIMLTTVMKGDFLQALADHTQADTPLGELSRMIFDCPRISLLDDDPNHLNLIPADDARAVLPIRSIRGGTKTTSTCPGWCAGDVVDFRTASPGRLAEILGIHLVEQEDI
ncbi:hypothetical protein IPL68_04145 [Candidatus Saccharibacteria bacterium]|nr:MAG: hypothetical protein IPL68_04145 [Candidatus Saccharibacteria bacterium]